MRLAAASFVSLLGIACAHRFAETQPAVVAPEVEDLSAEWIPAETHAMGTPATWRVREDVDGTRTVVVETQSASGTFNLLLSRVPHGPDLELAARVKANSGAIDQGGGLVWRALDADNYYVTRWNPLENNLRLYKVENGERAMLASVDTRANASAWHELRVTMVGTSISVEIDDGPRIVCDDATFAHEGAIGMWSKADASTSFTFPTVRTLAR